MNDATIACPKCGTEIKLTETLAAPIIATERSRLEAELKAKADAIETREKGLVAERSKLAEQKAELDRRHVAIEEQVAEKLKAAREAIEKDAAAKAATAAAAELKVAREALAEKDAKLAAAQKAELELRRRREALEEEKREFDLKLTRALDAEREKVANAIRAEEAKKAGEAVGAQLKAVQAALAEKDAKLAEAQKAELAIRKERQALEDEKRAFDLKLVRAVDDERQKIREATRKEDDEQYRLKLAEKDKVAEDMRKQIDELRRKSEQGSQQLQGEVQELDLKAMLCSRFPNDLITDVPKGQHGGDILQRVVGPNGRECGTILWEAKRTKTWSDQWLPKLRDDQREAKAELAAIMSVVLPKGVTTFDQVDGVWITSPICMIPLAIALRQTLIEAASSRQALVNQQGKMEMLYTYLTSPHFKQRLTAIVESYLGMQADLDSEKRAFGRIWSKRQKQLERMLGGLTGMYGDLQGIAGSSLPEVEGLDLPMLEAAPKDVETADTEDTEDEAA